MLASNNQRPIELRIMGNNTMVANLAAQELVFIAVVTLVLLLSGLTITLAGLAVLAYLSQDPMDQSK